MRTKSLAVAALFMALVMVTTAFVKIPLPLTGYIHLGDTFIFLACFFLKTVCDRRVCNGQRAGRRHRLPVYAPATLIIKAVMALIFCLIAGEEPTFWRCVLGAVAASVWMLAGYYVFNSVFLWGGARRF
ncbi:MAG: ECF transporter S component [Candidatus Borkfalkia sp.]